MRPRVLLAEDSADVRELLDMILSLNDFEVTVCRNGVEALALLASGRVFEAVVTDRAMPEMDGITATRTIRERGLAVPIVMVSANSSSEDVEEALKAGVNAFIAKPFQPEELVTTLKALLRIW